MFRNLPLLRESVRIASEQYWRLVTAGQHVQLIKRDEKGNGILEFGTEIIASADVTLAALLVASPGASTSVRIMLEEIERCFGVGKSREKIKEMIPAFGCSLMNDEQLIRETRLMSRNMLNLPPMA